MAVFSNPLESAVGRALRFIQMSGVFYCPSELREPWGLELPPMADCLWFHVVTAGGGWIAVGEADPIEFRRGDVLLVPHGRGHRIWGQEPAPTPSVFDLPHDELSDTYAVLRHGGDGAVTTAVCGGVRFDRASTRHLLDALPAVIHLHAEDVPRSDWLRATLDLMADEVRSVRVGTDAIVSRLCDLIVIQAIRSWVERDPAAQTGWLGALRDPHVGAAIAAVHRAPELDWTVGALATEAAMSRSAFAARFTELVGEPAMRYVTRWRMYRALDLLRDGETAAAAGRAVGYHSEAAFSRAFKRVIGVPPGAAA